MTAMADPQLAKSERKERFFTNINKADKYVSLLGLAWLTPLLKMIGGDDLRSNGKEIWRLLGVPLVAIFIFLGAWGILAPKVVTSLGAVPGPVQVWEQFKNLNTDHARQRDKETAFYERQDARNAKLVADGNADKVKYRTFTGAPTYYDQIWTSLKTVFFGFLVATAIAIPLGIAGGLSPLVGAGMNPIIQIFKPVSPLAWLPIVTMVVSATVTSAEPLLAKSFLVSAITVTLCSIWPTLINTTLGVASIDKDLVNVGKVLKLGTWTKITKLVLPSALPLIFTGLRLSLGVGWMVLIAAEMLAQNPGLGKFVWDEFQNGSSQSLAKIMVAVLTIGIIGYLLDRLMYALQSMLTFSADR
ncbi:nitrate ABC transporter permease [Amylibacter kogurei]|uniref:Nitrate ABC transporter permease n=1 Tax=Paramylibacter kogurei TaxID=1889778 RepID=A0A2G5K6F5_9RHOB|nr:ABC transporter permease [Amylibacter kogurei]PIB25015.1 nitrate ABC transporter permease [Amylibacter kogurei]